MSKIIASSNRFAVIGMGETGLSVARFLQKQNQAFIMLDTRMAPANLPKFVAKFPQHDYELGPLSETTLTAVNKIVISPGIVLPDSLRQCIENQHIPIVGDIQLFADSVTAPIVAITGSNAKSTVTTLVGEMAKHSGLRVGIGGNLGPPALELLNEVESENCELFVLELSSFQLETTDHLPAAVAAILNISEDHMDRYASLAEYHAAKQRIYRHAKAVVVNRDDPLTQPLLRQELKLVSFGLDEPDLNHFGLREHDGELCLAFGLQRLMPISELKLIGRHNAANALAALAIGHCIELPVATMLDVLRNFRGLTHRCEWVATVNEVDFIDDSKGTNVGATLAALHGLAKPNHKIVLIAGGDGKGADFSPLQNAIQEHVRTLVAIGKDGDQIAVLAERLGVPTVFALSMKDAVAAAKAAAQAGDTVLLSPACASFDMFENYVDRAQQFVAAVKEIT